MKKYLPILLAIFIAGTPLYAQTTINGDEVNSKLERFFWNVTNLIPGTVSQQSVWSRANINWGFGGTIGFGTSDMGNAIEMLGDTFNEGAVIDMDEFPESVPFTPVMGLDFRFGLAKAFFRPKDMALDMGISFMYFHSTWLDWNWNMFDFTIFTLGGDVRFSFLIPDVFDVTLGLGYSYTNNKYLFEPSGTSANFNFLTDTVSFSVQMSKSLLFGLLTPFLGVKATWSGTAVDYSWSTPQYVSLGGSVVGNNYAYSSVKQGKMLLYPQIYGGLGVFGNLVSLGASYDFAAKNFGAHVSVRLAYSGTRGNSNNRYNSSRYW
jgi:hypothetical protein